MSCDGTAIGAPFAGERMLFDDIISTEASICASGDNGMCTAIWSPSKSALNAVQTSGWIRMALPSTRTGSNAWIPSRCSVGARLSSTGCSRMTSSRMSHTSGRCRSTISLASLTGATRVRPSALLQDVPNFRPLQLDHLLGLLDGGDQPALFELVVDERLEQLEISL